MEPFVKVTGLVAPLDRVNVDTDQIIPAEFLKLIEKTGFGRYLFNSWRYLPNGDPNPDFELNDPAYQGATIMVTGRNFGSGSSREHAVWALRDCGIRAVIAPSFADIFHKNCFENGLVPVILADEVVAEIMRKAKVGDGYKATVNLEELEVRDESGLRVPFVVHAEPEVNEFRRYCLLNGLDEVGLTLQEEDKIAAYEMRHWGKSFSDTGREPLQARP
jgi:3-isopropylmalate/(R)-2-methylmalate dehydratase small subunit